MSRISFKEFLKLSEKEKCEKYKELNKHDKFLARMSQSTGVEIIGTAEMTEKDKKDLEEMEKYTNERIKKMKEMRKNRK